MADDLEEFQKMPDSGQTPEQWIQGRVQDVVTRSPAMTASQDRLIPTIELSATQLLTPMLQFQSEDQFPTRNAPQIKIEGRNMNISMGHITPPPSTLVNTFRSENFQGSPSLFVGRSPSLPSTASPVTEKPVYGNQPLPGLNLSSSSSPNGPAKSIFGGPVRNKPISSLAALSAMATRPTVPPEYNGDDDAIMIDAAEASLEARDKWMRHQLNRRSEANEIVLVKEELHPTSQAYFPSPFVKKPVDLARAAKLIAAQQVMFRDRTLSNGEGSSHDHAYVRCPSPLNQSFRRFEKSAFKRHDTHQTDPQTTNVATANHNENYSWMEGQDEDDHELIRMTRLRDLLMKKQRRNNISDDEALELFKVQRRIQTKKRLRAAATSRDEDGDEDDESSMLIPDWREDTVRRHRRDLPTQSQPEHVLKNIDEIDGVHKDGVYNDDQYAIPGMMEILADTDAEEEEYLDLKKSGKPSKPCSVSSRAKKPKDSREYFAREEERCREKERSKARKKKIDLALVPAFSKSRGNLKRKKKEERKKASKNKREGKGKAKAVITNGQSLLTGGMYGQPDGDDKIGQMILEDLIQNDPISDRLLDSVFDRAPEARISGPQVKTTQFQLLFANIPEAEDSSEKCTIRADKARLREASKSFGYAKCKAQDGKWLIKGMKSSLYHHQLLGAKWMVQRELSTQAPHGGLVADSMGLGKTIQTLACMVANPPGPGDIKRNVKATLIVVPATVIVQWIDEIGLHCDEKMFPKVLRYKITSNIGIEILQDIDIVVTSFNEVMRQFPFPDKKGRQEIDRVGYKRWWKGALEKMGPLHQVNWYRVVLDEAQAIKNNKSRTSLACQNLKSVYRWCLSGTPLLNRIEELFPYLRFLKANYSMDWQTFNRYFCDPDSSTNNLRIKTLLSYTMMRRTMKTKILNRAIIVLPKPHAKILYVQFSQEEQIIYRITENRFRDNLNAFFKKGEASRNYSLFLVQLLRLRQCTSHPFMLEHTIKESWTLEDLQELTLRLRKLKDAPNSRPFYEQCKLWVEQSEARRAERRQRGEVVPDEEMLPFGRSDYGHNFNMEKALKTLDEEELFKRVTCSICSDFPMEPMRTDCGHIFCNDCLDSYCHELAAQGDEYMTCPECNRIFQKPEKVRIPAVEHEVGVEDDENASGSGSRKGKGKKKAKSPSKGVDTLGFEPSAKDSSWVTESDFDPHFPFTPSSKTTALKALLLKGFEEAPLDKVVIYVQFRTLARIVGRICQSEGWSFVYLTGDSSLEHRTKAISHFRNDKNTMILIAGLKCGGLGLNFPWANRCISLDLWWNHAVEQQAFGRIFRIGQTKETFMTRIVVKNSVDMRMLTMQLDKLQDLEKAMRDGETKEKPSLSIAQLANLFGFLKTDADGKIMSIEADYQDGLSGEAEEHLGWDDVGVEGYVSTTDQPKNKQPQRGKEQGNDESQKYGFGHWDTGDNMDVEQ
ncbi:hypothetical protein BUE80_DR007992 [Diplocarpon rosae]|nr:hypothetical protein BUE80_DR007992 [Diplocarpon rosae]